ncbi:AzlD domain-containing protein [Pseudomonas fluorescens]|jgi:branched-subunit amino acid transport protein|uniref:Branched-chain amino acid ABC transporter n=1 Tax=Pseudomonas fluorescens TaxID=294 RepID=A0A2N1DXZ7_PSEFL|nr:MULTISPECIES: AzlD domain-containing protein [Pseudomonas]MBD8099417.1 AzlD domain-containing protein [Pseudomonas fluorescens]MBD8775446.1 AzlD domain-containing protein [Pseudomonas fluorescens]MBD8781450.1 AzlD domain-containing protein [Pseudomonas fluorescens]MBD8794628.1 AzlD domain-containing protein [Pseudomonas fluorescens]PKH15715.1 branched-chain amino acid ABC transporter [Pseudomonas fluorescens]
MIYLMIVAMALVVFFNRYLFIEPRLPVRLNRGTREFLGFAVPGMLTAICGPIIFIKDHQLDLSLSNPYLLAGVCAVGLMLCTRSVLVTVLSSMALFYLLRWWL